MPKVTSSDQVAQLEAQIQELQSRLKQAEQQIEDNLREFAYTSELAAAAFYSSAQLASVSELETGRFLDVNEVWVQTRGYSREEAIGKTADELNIWGADYNREKLIEDINKYGRLRNYETTSVMRSGEVRDFILNAEVLNINGHRLLFFSGMDITERKRYEKNLQRAQKMDAVGQLTGGIAHDFNNLLAIIQGNLELLAERTSDEENLERLVKSALHGTERGVDITRKLLSFSSRHESSRQVMDVNALIESTKDLVSKSVTATVVVETKLSEDLWPVELDPGELEDAIINLAVNAHDAMPEGGTLTIDTYNIKLDKAYTHLHPTVTPGDYVAVKVSDTGTGMDEATRDRMFEPFYTTKAHGKGTGLGLSMVFGFVSRAKGYIEVESRPKVGTSFTLLFPRAEKPAAQQGAVDEETTSTEKKQLPRGTETLLIVDDEVHLLEIAASVAGNLGYQVHRAENAKEALELLKKTPEIDLLFSDIVMPGEMNGFQLAAEARKIRPDLSILLTSGYSKSQELLTPELNSEIGDLASNILHKPYTQENLANSLRELLDG